MTTALIQNAIANSVVGLTRHVMRTCGKPDDEAYRMVYDSQIFELLSDPRTSLYLLTNEELCGYYEVEKNSGADALRGALIGYCGS